MDVKLPGSYLLDQGYTEVVHATLSTPIGDVPVRLLLHGDDWVLVAGKPGWGALDWPTEGTPIATGEYDADLDEITDLIRDAAIEGWQKIKAAAEPDPAYRMVYAEDVEPGMVLLDDDGTEMTVLDVRARDAVVSVVLVDDAGWQRSGYFAPLQQARLLVR